MDCEDKLVALINDFMITNEEVYLLEIETLIKGDGKQIKKDRISNVVNEKTSAEHMRQSLTSSILFDLNTRHKRPRFKQTFHAPLYIDWIKPDKKILMEKYDDGLGCVIEVYATRFVDSIFELHPPKKGVVIDGKLERIWRTS